MQLPVKILPRVGQQMAFIIGTFITLVMSFVLMTNALLAQLAAGRAHGAGGWLLVAASAGLFLAALTALSVGLINLLAGSPFQHLIIDRQGITRRELLSAKRFSWKELGPFYTIRTGLFRPRGSALKYWIIADTQGAIEGGATGLWPLSGTASLRIPAASYLWPGILVGSMALVSEDAAAWLEQLRTMARAGRFDPQDVPAPPAAFRTPVELAAAVSDLSDSSDADLKQGKVSRRRKPVIER
jgi:hypothetical protein